MQFFDRKCTFYRSSARLCRGDFSPLATHSQLCTHYCFRNEVQGWPLRIYSLVFFSLIGGSSVLLLRNSAITFLSRGPNDCFMARPIEGCAFPRKVFPLPSDTTRPPETLTSANFFALPLLANVFAHFALFCQPFPAYHPSLCSPLDCFELIPEK